MKQIPRSLEPFQFTILASNASKSTCDEHGLPVCMVIEEMGVQLHTQCLAPLLAYA